MDTSRKMADDAAATNAGREEEQNSGLGHTVKKKAEHAAHVAQENMTEAANTTKEKVSEASHKAQETAQKAKNRFKEMMD